MIARADVVVTGLGLVTPGGTDPGLPSRIAPAPGWFDPKSMLGPRGYKYLPAACQYLLAAANRALADAGGCLDEASPDRRGAVVGTNNAATALHDSFDRTVLDGRPAEISPALAPFFSVNVFASRLSIEHAMRAVNLTVNSPSTAGLDAIALAARMIRLGRADVVLAGATEEAVPVGDPGVAVAEAGSAVVVLEERSAASAAGRETYGTVAVRAAYGATTEVVADLLAGADAPTIDSWHVCADGSPTATAVRDALGRPTHEEPLGAGSLAPTVRLLALLAERRPGRHALVTASAEGNVALAVVTR